MAIFLDTGFYMGLVDPGDTHYERSNEMLKILQTGVHGQVFTSTMVMSETGTLVAVRTRNNAEILGELRELFMGEIAIAIMLQPNVNILNRTWDLFLKANNDPKKKPLSYVDCTNIIFCRYRDIGSILAYDGHFDAWLNRIS